MALSVKDAFLLSLCDGAKKNNPITTKQWLDEIGKDYLQRIDWFMQNGYLTYCESSEALNKMKVSDLKDILKKNGEVLTGKKDELIKRIIEKIPVDHYGDSLEKVYKITDLGKKEIEERSVYIDNKKFGFSFSINEIEEAEKLYKQKGNNDKTAIMGYLIDNNLNKLSSQKHFGLLRNEYHRLHVYYLKKGKKEKALEALLTTLYLDLSGMENNNGVSKYELLGVFLDTTLWGVLQEQLKDLNIDTNQLQGLFFESTNKCVTKLPFRYFEPNIMFQIMIDRLNGEQNLLEKYARYSNRPDPNNPNYNFVVFNNLSNNMPPSQFNNSNNNMPPSQVNNKVIKTSSGCLLPMIAILVAVIIVVFIF